MKKKIGIIIGVLVILLGVTGFFVYKALFLQTPPAPVVEEVVDILPEVDSSVIVTAKESETKANTVVLAVSGMDLKMSSVGYEVTYESQGLVKGVNSGSKPIDVSGKDMFEREIYLGTCSKNVCHPDIGVTEVSIVLEFTDASGKKSQFSKDFQL
jgi:hypothetical protein